MTGKTMAEHAREYRTRKAAKMQRFEAALCEIAGDRPDATGCDPQIMRNVARAALGL